MNGSNLKKGQSLDISMMAEPSVPAGQDAHLELDNFRRAFWQLSDDKREVLILVGASGLSYEETAKIWGCAEGTIKSRVSRPRLELRTLLGEGSFASLRRDTPALAGWFGNLLDRMPTRSMAAPASLAVSVI